MCLLVIRANKCLCLDEEMWCRQEICCKTKTGCLVGRGHFCGKRKNSSIICKGLMLKCYAEAAFITQTQVVRPLASSEKATSDQKGKTPALHQNQQAKNIQLCCCLFLVQQLVCHCHCMFMLTRLENDTGSSSSADPPTGTSDCEYRQYSSHDNVS